MRNFVDAGEVLSNLLGTKYSVDDAEVLIPLSALKMAIAKSTTLVVHEPEKNNDDINVV